MGVPGMTAAIPELTPGRPELRLPGRRPGLGAAQGPPGRGALPDLAARQPRAAAPAARSPRASRPPPRPRSPPSAPACRPGAHGLPGYTVRNPETGELMNQLRWQPWTAPQRLAAVPHGLPARRRGGRAHRPGLLPDLPEHPAHQGRAERRHLPRPARPARSGWTSPPSNSPPATARWSTRTTAELDGTGHRFGVDSDAWRGQLMYVDRLVQRLAEQLPPRTALYVTADHGMIDIPFDEQSPHRLRRGLGAARRRRPAGRRGPGPPCVRGAGRRRPTS